MPGKALTWTSRRKRRSGASHKNYKKKLLFCLLAASVIMILCQVLPGLLIQREKPVLHGETTASRPEQDSGNPSLARLLQKFVADNIPGLEPPVMAEGDAVRGTVLDAFHALTGLDPRDPRSILEQELGIGGAIALPVLHPPAGTRPETPREQERDDEPSGPEERKPVFAQVFPFLGYSEPVALVYHTHITESFVPSSGVRFSENLDQTVAYLGEELVRLLVEQYGLPLLHHQQIYDLPRTPAYQKARPALEKLLAENPQLEMVIDLHRDGVRREVTTTAFPEGDVGKILVVVGVRQPGWQNNFSFAMRLHQELEAVAPGISRGIRRYDGVYNQDLHPHAVLVEVGGHENTMEEALRSIPYLAEALARTYYLFFVQD